MRGLLISAIILCLPALLLAQESPAETVAIKQLAQAPVIDGVINEQEWKGAAVIDQPFLQFQPDLGDASEFRTVVYIAQTESALYIAFELFDPDMDRLSDARTQRDGDLELDDSISVMLDSFLDRRTAYMFQTNALGTQQDQRIADNGRTVDKRWDESWRSEATRLDDRWIVEMEIPFSILKFAQAESAVWGLNFQRTVPRRLEYAQWAPPSEARYRVSGFGTLSGIQPPGTEKAWTFIPYVLAMYEKDASGDIEAGGDIRWRPSTSLGVDLTFNPNFALVEADVEAINLTRFELRIPEKRPFFLEGNEMYSQRIEQFYSRRIGDISWGAKSNGKLGGTDFSAIATSADIDSEDLTHTDRADYAVLRLQHGFGKGSNVGILAANRHYLNDNSGSAGIDTTWFFTDTVGLTAQLLKVHGASDGLAWFVRPAWDTARSHFHVRYANLDEDIMDDFNSVGFLRDDDRKEWDTNANHKFWFEEGVLEQIHPSVNYNRYTSQDGVLRSWRLDAEVEFTFRSGWEIELYHLEEFKLFEKEYRNDRTRVEVEWDSREGRSISVFAATGFNYDSDLKLYGAAVNWLFGDKWRFEYEFTKLDLDPNPDQGSTTIHVFETIYAFNPNMYAKLFFQSNSAISKQNVQALWVWRFKPPFGSLQLAYQTGTSEQGQVSEQGDTFFTKLSWVF